MIRTASVPSPLSEGEESFALQCRVERVFVIREFAFHLERKWRFDFVIPGADGKLAVEIEGRGRHQSFGGFVKDCEKYNSATKLGWRILRYTPQMVKAGTAIADVLEILKREPRF